MTADEVEAYRLVYGRDPPDLRIAAREAALSATYAGADLSDEPEVAPPLQIADVTSETLKETLLGALALAHARVVSGKFGSGNGEQAGLEKLTALIGDFPALAKAVDLVHAYVKPEVVDAPTEVELQLAPKTASETVRRLRAMGIGK